MTDGRSCRSEKMCECKPWLSGLLHGTVHNLQENGLFLKVRSVGKYKLGSVPSTGHQEYYVGYRTEALVENRRSVAVANPQEQNSYPSTEPIAQRRSDCYSYCGPWLSAIFLAWEFELDWFRKELAQLSRALIAKCWAPVHHKQQRCAQRGHFPVDRYPVFK